MAFGFSSSYKSGLSGGAKAKSTPKSVQDIINRATAAATGAGMPLTPGLATYQTPGAATFQTVPAAAPKITPAAQTATVSGSPATGAGFAATAPAGYATPPTGSYGAGTVSQVPGNLPTNGTDAYSGFMSRFNPGAFQDQIYNDPQMVLNAMYQDLGLKTTSPLYATLRSLNNADPLSLFLLTNPNAAVQDVNTENYGNFLHNLYGSQMTPGGRTIDFGEALNNLAHPGANGALFNQLTQGGPAEQFRTYYGLAQDAAKMSLPPAIAAAFLNALANQGDTYLTGAAQSMNGQVSPFYQTAGSLMGR